MKKAFVAATIFIAATSAMAANWKLAETSKTYNVYVNTDSVRYQNDGSVIYMSSFNPKDGSASQVVVTQVDCNSSRFRVSTSENGFSRWDYVPPGSIISTFEKMYCK